MTQLLADRLAQEREALIRKIAEAATTVGFGAGEPAAELAGMLVSYLAANPERIPQFMIEGSELLLRPEVDFLREGMLTYRAVNGQIVHPSVVRAELGKQQ